MRYERDGFQVESAIRKGREVPEWYLEEPQIESADIFYMKAFSDLSTCRINGMGIGAIPWTSIIEYATWYGLENDVTEAFVDIIRGMDYAYMDFQVKAQQAKMPKK